MARIAFIWLTFILISSTAFASESRARIRCRDFLEPLFTNQIQVFHPETYARIHQHPIWKLSRELAQKKIPLTFELESMHLAKFLSAGMGEAIQTRALKRILHESFPEARIVMEDRTYPNTIALIVTDNAEDGNALVDHSGILEMSLMKRANPMIQPYTREGVRAAYHVNQDDVVASLYANSAIPEPRTRSNPDFLSILNYIPTTHKPNVFFVSQSFGRTAELLDHLETGFAHGYHVKLFSEWSKMPHVAGSRVIVVNDVIGKMPELYAMSDYAILNGANNLFEPLQQKRPLLFFNSPGTLEGYHPEVFNEMAGVAKKAGAIEVKMVDHLPLAFHGLSKIKPSEIPHPAFVINPKTGKDSFTELLDRLEKEVREHLGAQLN